MEAAGPAHDQHHAEAAVGQRRLRAREREPVVGGEDHDRVVGELVLVERVEHGADAVVERARARLVGGHVAPRLGRVGQVGGRQRVERVAHRGRLEVLAVRLEEPDREEERLRRALGDQPQRGRRDLVDVVVVDVDDVVVAEHAGLAREVLLADEPGPVAGVAQRVHDVVAVVVELEAAVGQPDHPVRVRPLAGQQARAAARAGGRGAERVAGTAGPGRRAAGCSASAPGGRRAARSGRCRASGRRRCWGYCLPFRWGRLRSHSWCVRRLAAAARCCARCSRAPVSPAGRRSSSSGCRDPGFHVSRESTSRASTTPSSSSCWRRPTPARPTLRSDPGRARGGHDGQRRVRGEADVDAPARPRGPARPPARRGAPPPTAARPALRPRDARRQGLPGRLAVARGADARVARRRR